MELEETQAVHNAYSKIMDAQMNILRTLFDELEKAIDASIQTEAKDEGSESR